MNKLNKKYNSKQIIELVKEGKIAVKPNYTLNTYGTSGSGLVVRKGLTIKNIETQKEKDYQIIFSARGSYGGTITSDLMEYNGRMLEKHHKYQRAVNDWFNDFLNKLGWFDRFLSNLLDLNSRDCKVYCPLNDEDGFVYYEFTYNDGDNQI